MDRVMTSSQSLSKLNKLFWLLTGLILLLFAWASFFEIDKSLTASGEVKPLGKPISMQNRFEGKVLEVFIAKGEEVEASQKLVSFETEIDQTELNEIQTMLETLLVKRDRLSIQLDSSKNFPSNDSYNQTIYLEQKELLQNERNGLSNKLSTFDQEIRLKESEFNKLQDSIEFLKNEIKIAEAQLDLSTKLYESNFEGKITLMEKQGELLKKQNALTENYSQVELITQEIKLINSKSTFEIGEFKKNTLRELIETKEQLRIYKLKKDGADAKIKEFYLSAPIAGTISNLYSSNQGQIFRPGDTILDIIPKDQPLVFYAKLPVQYIDEVQVNQQTLITLSTLDSRSQKPFRGTLVDISPDATTDEDEAPFYEIRVEFNQEKNLEKQAMLKSGMTGNASILLGKRTVIEYFLDPIFIALRQVMKEI